MFGNSPRYHGVNNTLYCWWKKSCRRNQYCARSPVFSLGFIYKCCRISSNSITCCYAGAFAKKCVFFNVFKAKPHVPIRNICLLLLFPFEGPFLGGKIVLIVDGHGFHKYNEKILGEVRLYKGCNTSPSHVLNKFINPWNFRISSLTNQ